MPENLENSSGHRTRKVSFISNPKERHREGNGNPLQYSQLENPMYRGAWQATAYGVAEPDIIEWLSTQERQCQRMLKLLHNCSSHTVAKKCSKFSKQGFNSMWTVKFQMFKLDLEKTEEPEIKLPTFFGSLKKQKSSRKTSTCVLLTTSKPLTVWMTTNRGRFLKRWEYQTTWPASWEICMQVKKQQLELDMKQQTGSK